jgi:hypothetical protein
LALERWPREVWVNALELAEEIDAAGSFAAGLRLVPEGEQLAEALNLPETGPLDWSIRHQSRRPRGTFYVAAFASATGVSGRWRLLRRALVPKAEWIMAEYPWAAEGKLRLRLAYALHIGRTPRWIIRAWCYRRRAKRAASSS